MIVVKDTVPLTGKGFPCPEVFLGCGAASIVEANPADCALHDVVVFHISEDSTPHMRRWEGLAAAVREIRPDVAIWNEPRCDLGDKLAVDDFVRLHGGIPGLKMPRSWRLNRLEDCDSVAIFPCVVRKPRGWGGAGTLLAVDAAGLRDAANRLACWPLQAAEFIAPDTTSHMAVRFQIVGDTLAGYWALPSDKPIVHASDTDWDRAIAADRRFAAWLPTRDLSALVGGVRAMFGPGWYLLDLVWSRDSLWFCEIGYKIFDPHREDCFRAHGVQWTPPKRMDDPAAMQSLIRAELARLG